MSEFRGKTEHFKLPYQVRDEPMVVDKNRSQMIAIENLFCALFSLLGLDGKRAILDEGDITVKGNVAKLSDVILFTGKTVVIDNDISWTLPKNEKVIFLYIVVGNGGMSDSKNYEVVSKTSKINNKNSFLIAHLTKIENEYKIDMNPVGKPRYNVRNFILKHHIKLGGE